jgi:hypothetical protein
LGFLFKSEGCLTPTAPDRLRRGYAAALCRVSCYDELVALQESAAGEPNRWAAHTEASVIAATWHAVGLYDWYHKGELNDNGQIETTNLPISVYLGITYILLGAPIGICQWLILRKHFRYASWWIVASVAGYVFGLAGIITVLPIMTYVGGKVLASLVIGLLIGAVTGAVLVWLFRHPLQKLEFG